MVTVKKKNQGLPHQSEFIGIRYLRSVMTYHKWKLIGVSMSSQWIKEHKWHVLWGRPLSGTNLGTQLNKVWSQLVWTNVLYSIPVSAGMAKILVIDQKIGIGNEL